MKPLKKDLKFNNDSKHQSQRIEIVLIVSTQYRHQCIKGQRKVTTAEGKKKKRKKKREHKISQ